MIFKIQLKVPLTDFNNGVEWVYLTPLLAFDDSDHPAIPRSVCYSAWSRSYERDSQAERTCLTLLAEISNLFFIGLFTVEMLLKLYSLGLHGYHFHQFSVTAWRSTWSGVLSLDFCSACGVTSSLLGTSIDHCYLLTNLLTVTDRSQHSTASWIWPIFLIGAGSYLIWQKQIKLI